MFIILVKRLFAYFKNVLAGKIALYSGEAISDSLSKEIFLFLQNNETSFIHSLAQRTNQETFSLTFFSVKKEAKKLFFIHSLAQRTNQETSTPTKSPPILGDLTENRGNRRFIRGLVWLTKPVPLRGEPWIFYYSPMRV